MNGLLKEDWMRGQPEAQTETCHDRLIGNDSLRVRPLIGLTGLPMQGLREIKRRLIREVEDGAPPADDQHP